MLALGRVRLLGANQAFHDLLAIVGHALGCAGNEDRRGAGLGTNVGHSLKPLIHHQHTHDRIFRRARIGVLQIGHRLGQTFDDFQALQGNAFTFELVGVALGFRLLDAQRFLGFALGAGGFAIALCGVDLVHRFLHLCVRVDLGDEGLDDGVAEVAHVLSEFAVDGFGNGALAVEHFIQVLGGHLRTHHIEDEGFDLRFRARELVNGIGFTAVDDVVLHRHGHAHRDLVFRDRVDGDDVLQHLQVENLTHCVNERNLEVEAGAGGFAVLAEALDDLDRLVGDLEEGHAQNCTDDDQADDNAGPKDDGADEVFHFDCFQ